MRISDWSSDVCSSDLIGERQPGAALRFGHQCVEKSRGFDRVPQRRRVAACLDGAHDRRSAGALEQSLERSEEHTSELQSLMRISYAVFCLKKKNNIIKHTQSARYKHEHRH